MKHINASTTRRPNLRKLGTSSLLAFSLLAGQAAAEDWPQFNGPDRNGHLDEKYQLTELPKSGLEKLWSTPISGGYSGPAVADGKVFVSDFVIESGEVTNNPGAADKLVGAERLLCLDESTGKILWTHSDKRSIEVSFGSGPRTTPTIDGGLVYTLGSEGHLEALDIATGKLVWDVSLKDQYAAKTPTWGFASSPLIHGDLLYTLAGGEGSIVVALDKRTGKEAWKSVSASGIGYCPPMLITIGDDQLLLAWDAEKLNCLDLKSGRVYWSEPLSPSYEMAIAPPLQNGDHLYVSGIGEIGRMYRIKPDNSGLETLWTGTPKTAAYFSNAAGIFTDNFIVGSDCGSGNLIAFNAVDGKRYWETLKPTSGTERRASHGTAFTFKGPGDVYYLFSETGDLIVAELTPENYKEVSRQHLIDATNSWQGREVVWAYPAFANNTIFVRNDKEIAAFRFK